MSKLERLQKVLRSAGVASRRSAEDLIREGRVRVGGRIVTELGTKVDPERDRVELDGKRLIAESRAYVVLHKPREVMCTMRDPEGRKTVADLVRGVGARVVPIGRLDFHTSGVLLLTNDGDFAATLAHPKKGAPKTYVAKVRGSVGDEALARFSDSIEIDGRATRPAAVRILRHEGDKTWIEVTLHEGRNRQVRRLGDIAGHPVLRLVRTTFAGIDAEGLRPGEWRYLSVDELVQLKKTFGVPRRVKGAEAAPGVFGRVSPRAGGFGRDAREPTRVGREPRSRSAGSERPPVERSGRYGSEAGRGSRSDSRRGSEAGRGSRSDSRRGSEAGRGSRSDSRRGSEAGRGSRWDSRPSGEASRGSRWDSPRGREASRGSRWDSPRGGEAGRGSRSESRVADESGRGPHRRTRGELAAGRSDKGAVKRPKREPSTGRGRRSG
ncbi:MAG: pseudouridine synthase [Polyangiaceae bacterium]